MKKGDIFEFFCHEADYEHYCHVDFEKVNEQDVRKMLADLYRVEPGDIRINLQPLCTAESGRIENLSYFWREWNIQRKVNEYEGLPSSAYLKEFLPQDLYRVILDKKKNELEIVLKNGASITLFVEADKIEKQLLFGQ